MCGVQKVWSTLVCPLRLCVPASNSHVRPLPFAGFGVLPRYLYAPLHFKTPALFYNTKSLVLIQSCYLGSFWIWEGFVCCEHSGRRSSFSFSDLPDSSALSTGSSLLLRADSTVRMPDFLPDSQDTTIEDFLPDSQDKPIEGVERLRPPFGGFHAMG